MPDFEALGVAVVGTSIDPVVRLQKFRDKYGIGFPFASDEDRAIGTAYGTLKGGPETTHARNTVVIGKDGTVLVDVKQLRAEGRL